MDNRGVEEKEGGQEWSLYTLYRVIKTFGIQFICDDVSRKAKDYADCWRHFYTTYF